MSEFPAHDNEDGIRNYLSDLSSFHTLLELRRASVIAQHSLRDFIVLGSFMLKKTGEISKITFTGAEAQDSSKSLTSILQHILSDVILLQDAFRVLADLEVSSTQIDVPKPDEFCQICGQNWKMSNLSDLVRSRGEEQIPLHRECARVESHCDTLEYFEKIVQEAGVGKHYLTPTMNRYWNDKNVDPWVVVHTAFGRIEIGWRKRVIQIDWADTKKNLGELFSKEGVTFAEEFVHAWGRDQAVKFLNRAWMAISHRAWVAISQ